MLEKLHKKRTIYTAIISIILLALLIKFIIQPSIIGYSTYQQAERLNYSLEDYGNNMKNLESRILIFNTNLSSCIELNKKLWLEFEKYSDKFSECKGNLDALRMKSDLTSENYEEDIEDLEKELDKKNEEINELRFGREKEIRDLELQHNVIIQNVANNICCKAKVDNSNINYYRVENDKIICSEGGTLGISCYDTQNAFPLSINNYR